MTRPNSELRHWQAFSLILGEKQRPESVGLPWTLDFCGGTICNRKARSFAPPGQPGAAVPTCLFTGVRVLVSKERVKSLMHLRSWTFSGGPIQELETTWQSPSIRQKRRGARIQTRNC